MCGALYLFLCSRDDYERCCPSRQFKSWVSTTRALPACQRRAQRKRHATANPHRDEWSVLRQDLAETEDLMAATILATLQHTDTRVVPAGLETAFDEQRQIATCE